VSKLTHGGWARRFYALVHWSEPHGLDFTSDDVSVFVFLDEGAVTLRGKNRHTRTYRRRAEVPEDVVDRSEPASMYPLARRGLR